MVDERAEAGRGPLSEQQEGLEPRHDPGGDPGLRRAGEAAGPQYTAPGGSGDFTDDEATSIADEAGASYPSGPENQAMHVEGEEEPRDE